MTLVEMMVYLAIMGFFLSAIYLVLISGLRYMQTSQAYADTQQQSTNALAMLLGELTDSNPAGVVVGSASDVEILSPRRPDGLIDMLGTNLAWQKWVCYAVDANTHAMHRAEIKLASPVGTLAPLPPLPPLVGFLANPTARVVATNVAVMNVTAAGPRTFALTLEVQDNPGTARLTQLQLQGVAQCRN